MGHVYIDMDGGGSSTSPYETWAKAASDPVVGDGAASAGDSVWVQGNTTFSTAKFCVWPATDMADPVLVHGVRAGTTNEPPTTADLIPGKRTGEATLQIDGATDAELLIVTDNITNDTQTGAGTISRISIVSAGSDPTMTISITLSGVTGKFEDNDVLSSTDHGTFSGDCAGDLMPYAWQAVGLDAPPSWTGGASDTLYSQGAFYHYGIKWIAGTIYYLTPNAIHEGTFEECTIGWGNAAANQLYIGKTTSATEGMIKCIGCELSGSGNGGYFRVREANAVEFYDCVLAEDTDANGLLRSAGSIESHGFIHFYGCDFSILTNPVYRPGTSDGGPMDILFSRCLFGAGWSPVSGLGLGDFKAVFDLCDTATGKSSGSIVNTSLHTLRGDAVSDTSHIRTGGAEDPSGQGWAWALTPISGNTVRGYFGMWSPWAHAWTDGTDTSVAVYVANSQAESSPANDYHDDEIWLEVEYPGEYGTAQATRITTRMDLLGTPADVASDASTWGSGANNGQKLTATIAPAYEGPVSVRVWFASGATDTLYFDPLPELT